MIIKELIYNYQLYDLAMATFLNVQNVWVAIGISPDLLLDVSYPEARTHFPHLGGVYTKSWFFPRRVFSEFQSIPEQILPVRWQHIQPAGYVMKYVPIAKQFPHLHTVKAYWTASWY